MKASVTLPVETWTLIASACEVLGEAVGGAKGEELKAAAKDLDEGFRAALDAGKVTR